MKVDIKQKVVMYLAIPAFTLVWTFLLLDLNVFLPSLLLIVLLCVNLIPLNVLKSKNVQLGFGTNFRILSLLNSVVLGPVLIEALFRLPFDNYFIQNTLIVGVITLVFSLVGALIHTSFPQSKTVGDEHGIPLYKVKDILMQPKADSLNKGRYNQYIPEGNSKRRSLGFKVMIWVMMAVIFLIPLYATVENGYLMNWGFLF